MWKNSCGCCLILILTKEGSGICESVWQYCNMVRNNSQYSVIARPEPISYASITSGIVGIRHTSNANI